MKQLMAKPDRTIEQHNKDLLDSLNLLKKYGYISSEHTLYLIEKACEYHDTGKANEEFQIRVNAKQKIRFDANKEIPHNMLSIYFINPDDFSSHEDYVRVVAAVAYHHDYGNVFEVLREKKELRKKLLQGMNTYRVKVVTLGKEVNSCLTDCETIFIKGILHKCDYSASGDFIVEYPNDFLTDSLCHMMECWQQKEEMNDTVTWNELQIYCKENTDHNIMIIGSTGMGKTEGGLWWIGDNKGFFVLPLRTAINAIYDRTRGDVLQNINVNQRLALLHSDSLKCYINRDEALKEENDLMEYNNRGRRLSMPLTICTMDQLFDFVFRYQGYELKLATLSYSKVVIDEIQMYGPDLLAYLVFGLEKVNEMGGKIAIMTATLAPFIEDLLRKNIPFKATKTFTTEQVRHNLKVLDAALNAEDIIKVHQKNKRLGRPNNILVVCNTVKLAQEIYQNLKDDLDDSSQKEVHIIHSKFIHKDRSELELDIQMIQTDTSLQNQIWIATSIVEASLDIDFDYLFTELQDLNSLFQRLGRCNRKGKKSTEETNCFVYTKIKESLLNKGFIDRKIFELSKEVLVGVDGLLSEQNKMDLINESFTTEKLKESDYMVEYRKIYNELRIRLPYDVEKSDVNLRNIISYEVIPSPVFQKYKDNINELEKRILDCEDKLELERNLAELNEYVVNIPGYEYINYQKAVYQGKAESYKKIKVGGKKEIPVIECIYDEMGVRMINFNNRVVESIFI